MDMTERLFAGTAIAGTVGFVVCFTWLTVYGLKLGNANRFRGVVELKRFRGVDRAARD